MNIDLLPIKDFNSLINEPKVLENGKTFNVDSVYNNIIKPLYNKLQNNDLVGNGTVELIGTQFTVDPFEPDLSFNGKRRTHNKYSDKELVWYLAKSLSIIGYVDDVAIWQQCCTKDDKKEINSNYGYLVFSEENGDQFINCLEMLKKDKYSREALLIYTRPFIYKDYIRDGAHDFICTISSHFFIRNNKLEMIHNFRSQDFMFGWCAADWIWNCFVYQNMYLMLKETYPDLERGNIIWRSDSMHVYERHFDLLKQIAEEN